MTINENFCAYLAKEVGDNKSIIEHFIMLLEKLYDESWNTLTEEDMADYNFSFDLQELADENDTYNDALCHFIDSLHYVYHNDPWYKLNEFAASYWFQRRVSRIEDLLLNCTELRELFHPTEDCPTYEAMVRASINWSIDNHKDERWTLEQSAIEEMLYYKMINIVGIPAATLRPIYDKLIESVN